MTNRLRVVGFQILPAVVWDDGESLSPGPPLEAVQVAPADLEGSSFLERFVAELASSTPPEEPAPPNRQQRRAQARIKPAGTVKKAPKSGS